MAAEAAAEDGSTVTDGIVFALSPATASTGLIDYNTKQGAALWAKATEKLGDELFDCTGSQLRDLLKVTEHRAEVSGWKNGICDIPINTDDLMGETQDIFTHYGQMTEPHLRAYVSTYINTECRATQDDVNMYSCLFASLSKEGRDKVTIHESSYTVNGRKSGILLLKVIIRESYVDTNATVMSIRKKFLELDTYLISVNYDIHKLNTHVMMLLEGLTARGATTTDLLPNLFKAYSTVKDKDFAKYITNKEDDYEEGSSDLTPIELMNYAKTKYSILKEKGTWNAPSEEETKILALEAKLKVLERKKKQKTPTKSKKSDGNNNGGDDKDKPPSWKKVPPKTGEPWTIQKNDRTWNWCKYHKFWAPSPHSSDNCSIKDKSNEENQSRKNKDKREKKLASALQGVAAEDDSSSDRE